MQEEEKNNGMEGMSVEEMFLGVQESYQEAQLRAQEENRAFARTEFFRMDKFGTYRLRILPIAPNPDGSPTRPGYERYGTCKQRILLPSLRSVQHRRHWI